MTQSKNTETSMSQTESAQALSDQDLEVANGGFSLSGIVGDVESGVSAAKNWTANVASTVKNAAENHPYITGGIVATVAVGAFACGAGEEVAATDVTDVGLKDLQTKMINAFKDN